MPTLFAARMISQAILKSIGRLRCPVDCLTTYFTACERTKSELDELHIYVLRRTFGAPNVTFLRKTTES